MRKDLEDIQIIYENQLERDRDRFNLGLQVHQLQNELGAIKLNLYNRLHPKVEDIRDFLNRENPRVDVALEIINEILEYLQSIK